MKKLFILLLDQLGTDRGENIDSYHSVLSPLSAGGAKKFSVLAKRWGLANFEFSREWGFFSGGLGIF